MKFASFSLAIIQILPTFSHTQDKNQASEFLRTSRANSGTFEEYYPADLQQECIIEKCTYQEVQDAFVDNETGAESYWAGLVNQCMTKNLCHNDNTIDCTDIYNGYTCNCKDGFEGVNCETAKVNQQQEKETRALEENSESEEQSDYYDDVTTSASPDNLEAMLEKLESLRSVLNTMSIITTDDKMLEQLKNISGQLDTLEEHLRNNMGGEDASLSSIEDILNQLLDKERKTKAQTTDFRITCEASKMTVQLTNGFRLKSHLHDNRNVHVDKIVKLTRSASVCDAQPSVLEFEGSSSISLNLANDCYVRNYVDSDYIHYSFEFKIPPKTDTTTQVVTDWGSSWIASCTYDRHKTVSIVSEGQILPVLVFNQATRNKAANDDFDMKDKGMQNETGVFDIKMQIYETAAYNNVIDVSNFPMNVQMGEKINAEVTFSNAEDAKFLNLVTESCWATPSVDSSNRIDLIDDRCPSSELASLSSSRNMTNDRFNTQVFKFPGNQIYLYIKCAVSICQDRLDHTDMCARSCSKKKRSYNRFGRALSSQMSGNKRAIATIGPFVTMQSENEKAHLSKSEPVAQKLGHAGEISYNLTGVNMFFAMIIIVLVIAAISINAKIYSDEKEERTRPSSGNCENNPNFEME